MLVSDSEMGVPLYPVAQKPDCSYELAEGWKQRIGKTYITCDLTERDLLLDGPCIVNIQTFGDGILTFFMSNQSHFSAISCGDDDTDMFLDAPGWGSLNQWAAFIEHKDGEEILAIWDYDFKDTSLLKPLSSGTFEVSPRKNGVFKTDDGMLVHTHLPEGVAFALVSLEGKLIQVYHAGDAIPALKRGYAIFISDDKDCMLTMEVRNAC